MADVNVNNAELLSNPVPSPLIDRDEPAPAKPAKGTEKPAPAADEKKAETPDATDENANPDEKKQDDPQKQSRRQRKLQIERDARIRAETRAEMAERALAEAKKPAEAKETVAPKRDDFESYEDYLDARNDYRDDQRAKKAADVQREEAQRRQSQAQAQTEVKRQTEDWNKREADFKAKVPTYEDDVIPFVEGELQQLSKEARQAIVELGPDVLHHVAMNDELIDELLKLSPIRQVARLGRIDTSSKPDTGAQVPDADDDEPAAEPAPKPRRAEPPAPAKHVRHGNTAPAALSDDMDTYIQQRRKQGARWAR